MRAIVQGAVGDVDVLELREVPEPELKRGSVLIRTTAVGVNFHDVEIRRRGERGRELPLVPGTDVAGVVERVADGVRDFAPGDRVVALVQDGGYAEQVLASAALTAPIPDGIDDVVAASTPVPGLTAWFLCRGLLGPQVKQVVAYAAAGGVGCWLGALLSGAPVRAIGIVSGAEKVAVARRAGYDHVVDRSEHASLVDAVRDATLRRGADVVLDAVGGSRFGDSFRMLRADGTVMLYGRAAGAPALNELEDVFLDARGNFALRTFFLTRALMTHMGAIRGAFAELFALVAAGALHVPVRELALAQAGEAQRVLESGHTSGKVVLRP